MTDVTQMVAQLLDSIKQRQQPSPPQLQGLLSGAGTVIPYANNMPSNLQAATKELKLTPQEQFLYQHGINNMNAGKTVTQPGGEVSSILQMVVDGPGGKIYNIPSVWDGKQLDERAAIKRAAEVGWDKWPSYPSYNEADRRYIEDMHPYMDKDIQDFTARQQSKKVKK